MRRRRPRGVPARSVLALLASVLLLPACTAAPEAVPGAAVTSSVVGADASRTRAAELRAGLTHLLVERVYATAAARAVLDEDGSSDAVAALDDRAVALADLLGATYTGAREPLLQALREVDRRVVAHAAAERAGAPAAALVELQQAQASLATVVRRVVPQLGAERVATRLADDLAAQLAVGGAEPYAALRVVAQRMPDTAGLLSVGIAEDRGLGRAGTQASMLRAQLTGLLTEHVLLAGEVAAASPAARPQAVAALRTEGEELTGLLGTAYVDLAQEFGPAWSRHVDRVVALADTPGDQRRQRAVLAFSGELGDLLARHVDGLPSTAVVVEADPVLAALLVAVADDASRTALHEAIATVPVLSALLAAAIAEDRGYA